jgi:hypothetical protein
MRTRTDFDLEDVQRAAQLRRLGRDLHDEAAAISVETVQAMAAVVSRLTATTDYGELVEKGFGEAMVSHAATTHLGGL